MNAQFDMIYAKIEDELDQESLSKIEHLDIEKLRKMSLIATDEGNCPIHCTECPISVANLRVHVACGHLIFNIDYSKIDFLEDLQKHLFNFDYMIRDFVDEEAQ